MLHRQRLLRAAFGAGLLAALSACPRGGEITNFDQVQIPLGVWREHPAGKFANGWVAKPGENFQVDVKWPGPGNAHFCLFAGKVDEKEQELEDVEEATHVCPPQDESGVSSGKIQVPKDGNAIWYTTAPEGGWPRTFETRIQRG